MTEKQFTDIEVGADTGRVRLYNGINFVEYSSSELLDLLNEQHEQIQEFNLFKLKVSMAIQHRINWLKKQIWDNRDRINELQSLKKELKL